LELFDQISVSHLYQKQNNSDTIGRTMADWNIESIYRYKKGSHLISKKIDPDTSLSWKI